MSTLPTPAINRKALDLLHIYTGHTFEIDRLAGRGMKLQRQQIMGALHGRPKMPLSASGVTAIERAFYLMAGIALEDCTCLRDREIKFSAWAKSKLEATV